MADKKYAEAIKAYEKIVVYDEDNIIALYYLARLNAEVKDYKKAKEYYSRVIELKPGFEPALLDMATLYEMEGNFDKAMEHYQKVLMLDPMNKKGEIKGCRHIREEKGV